MTESEAIVALVAFWRGKAAEALESAELEYSAGHLSFALNRAYYAAFYAASAALLQDGHKFGKHSAVQAAFHRYLVKSGRVSDETGSHYDRLFDERHAADYEAFVVFRPAEVRMAIDRTVLLVGELTALPSPGSDRSPE